VDVVLNLDFATLQTGVTGWYRPLLLDRAVSLAVYKYGLDLWPQVIYKLSLWSASDSLFNLLKSSSYIYIYIVYIYIYLYILTEEKLPYGRYEYVSRLWQVVLQTAS
jgi:hypothetical protein